MSSFPFSQADRDWMNAAIEVAHAGKEAGEVPVGAVLVQGDDVVAKAHNETVATGNPTRHAELVVVEAALHSLGVDRLTDATLYVTLEPCAQCAGAIVLAKVGRVLFGAYDEKAGMAGSVEDLLRHPQLNHRPEVRGGVLEAECGQVLENFFADKRAR